MDVRTIAVMGVRLASIALLGGCDPASGGAASGGESGSQAAGSTTDGGTAEDGGSTGSTIVCTDPDTQVLWTVDGVLELPMESAWADQLGRDVVRSGTPEEGTVAMTFTTRCEGPVYLWALVWDETGGAEPDNADSFHYALDAEQEATWLYGCNTVAAVDERWWWLPVEVWADNDCAHDALDVDLSSGEHTLTLRNREEGGGRNVAAIGAVVLSHDPSVDPNMFFQLES